MISEGARIQTECRLDHLRKEARKLGSQLAPKPGSVDEIGCLAIAQAAPDVDRLLGHRVCPGALLDARTTMAAEDHHGRPGTVVDDDRREQFAFDVEPLLDQDLLDGEVAAGGSQDGGRGRLGLGGIGGEAHPAHLGPPRHPDLRLHHHGPVDIGGQSAGGRWRCGHPADRRTDPELA